MKAHAQTSESSVPPPSTPELRIPTDERLQEIQQMDAYTYGVKAESLSLWDRFIMWLLDTISEKMSIKWVNYLVKAILIVLFLSIAYLLLSQIFKGNLGHIFKRKNNRTLLNLNYNTSSIHVEDFDALINEAINQKSFSLAVRYLYLKALKELDQKELIVVKEAKTNYDYLQELRGHPVEQTFDRLTYFHEYVDYGEFEIDEPRFHKIKEVFDTFLRRLHG